MFRFRGLGLKFRLFQVASRFGWREGGLGVGASSFGEGLGVSRCLRVFQNM